MRRNRYALHPPQQSLGKGVSLFQRGHLRYASLCNICQCIGKKKMPETVIYNMMKFWIPDEKFIGNLEKRICGKGIAIYRYRSCKICIMLSIASRYAVSLEERSVKTGEYGSCPVLRSTPFSVNSNFVVNVSWTWRASLWAFKKRSGAIFLLLKRILPCYILLFLHTAESRYISLPAVKREHTCET